MEKIIETKDLMIGYRRRSSGYSGTISRRINISAVEGELLAVVGLNGAGKSTLLRTLAGLQKAVDGKVFLKGKPLLDYSRNELARVISFVSTEPVVVPYLKVFDLAAMGRYPYTGSMGRLSMGDKLQVVASLELVGLQSMIWRNVETLSDGERQRVMIARTLVQDTPVILFDEPTAFLDIPNKYDTLALLKRLAHRQHKTIIYSTHDISLAMRTADKIWLINNASIAEGAPEDTAIQQAINSLFEGSNLEYNHLSGDITLDTFTRGDIAVFTKNDPGRVRNALARWGYNCLLNPSNLREELPKATVVVKKNEVEITYQHAGNEYTFNSFYAFGLHLRNNPPMLQI